MDNDNGFRLEDWLNGIIRAYEPEMIRLMLANPYESIYDCLRACLVEGILQRMDQIQLIDLMAEEFGEGEQ